MRVCPSVLPSVRQCVRNQSSKTVEDRGKTYVHELYVLPAAWVYVLTIFQSVIKLFFLTFLSLLANSRIPLTKWLPPWLTSFVLHTIPSIFKLGSWMRWFVNANALWFQTTKNRDHSLICYTAHFAGTLQCAPSLAHPAYLFTHSQACENVKN